MSLSTCRPRSWRCRGNHSYRELSLSATAELSTDSRKLFAGKHVDDTGAADARFHHDKTGMIARDFANDGGVLTKGMRFHGAQHKIDILRGDKGEKLSFVRNIKWIEAEDLAGAFHFFANRNARLVEKHPNFRRLRDFSKRACDSATRRVAQNVDVDLRGEHGVDQAIQRCGVTGDLGFEFQTFAHRHDRDAMHRNRSAQQNLVADLRAARMNILSPPHSASA